jgi:prevent-host-death family protein
VEVGVRQLRDELRRWLDAVRRGEEVIVTERGKPIARLIGASTPPPLERLIAAGIVTPAERPRKPSRAYRRVDSKGSVSELVAEQRR